jgi:hypothetical protein
MPLFERSEDVGLGACPMKERREMLATLARMRGFAGDAVQAR